MNIRFESCKADSYENAEAQLNPEREHPGLFGYARGGELEVQGYVPTREELFQIVKFWATCVIDSNYFSFLYDDYYSRLESGLCIVAEERIGRISELIGNEVIARAIRNANGDFAKSQNPVLWRMYVNGEEPKLRDNHGFPVLEGEE
jgi:hypothetical protein